MESRIIRCHEGERPRKLLKEDMSKRSSCMTMLVSSGQFDPPNLISLLKTTAKEDGERRVDYLRELW